MKAKEIEAGNGEVKISVPGSLVRKLLPWVVAGGLTGGGTLAMRTTIDKVDGTLDRIEKAESKMSRIEERLGTIEGSVKNVDGKIDTLIKLSTK
jgi:hypothetical protein